MHYDTILLDMDGVFADFHREAVRAHMRIGRIFPKIGGINPLDLTHERFTDLWHKPGLSLQKNWFPETVGKKVEEWFDGFWKPIDQDPFFWRNMEPYPWWKDIIQLANAHADEVVIVTSPHSHPNSYQGKRQWLIRHGLGHYEAHFCRQKWRLSRPGTLLIDDHLQNTTTFINPPIKTIVPGEAVLFPGIWNADYVHSADPVAHIKKYLEGTKS